MGSGAAEVVLEGRGLHTGSDARVVLRRRSGEVAFVIAREIPPREAKVVGTERATTLSLDGRSVATVEHLLGAFGGLGIHQGVSIEVMGPEVPLVDGGALAFCGALRQLGAPSGRGELEVACDGQVVVGAS